MMLKSSSNIGIGGRILSDFIAGDYLDDFLSLFRVSKRRYCKSGNGGDQL